MCLGVATRLIHIRRVAFCHRRHEDQLFHKNRSLFWLSFKIVRLPSKRVEKSDFFVFLKNWNMTDGTSFISERFFNLGSALLL